MLLKVRDVALEIFIFITICNQNVYIDKNRYKHTKNSKEHLSI